jgi:hypothetical protein
MNKTQKVTVTLQVVVPTGTSKTKVEKTIKSLLKLNTPADFKIGIPHAAIIEPAPRKPRLRKKYEPLKETPLNEVDLAVAVSFL